MREPPIPGAWHASWQRTHVGKYGRGSQSYGHEACPEVWRSVYARLPYAVYKKRRQTQAEELHRSFEDADQCRLSECKGDG